ncbi:MAG: hypothetical protein HQM06_05005 [Magnetococcales bacterium]|nr:hypothetical protein [Magnetococcales bacterium]
MLAFQSAMARGDKAHKQIGTGCLPHLFCCTAPQQLIKVFWAKLDMLQKNNNCSAHGRVVLDTCRQTYFLPEQNDGYSEIN